MSQPELREASTDIPVVNSFNDWDPLEEVIVGAIDGAAVPPWTVALRSTLPETAEAFFRQHAGRPFPEEIVAPAREELEEFARILEAEGVVVRRPDKVDQARPFRTPHWQSPAGLYAAMPRDCLLCVGNEIIEVPMAWRSRYHETGAFRRILKDYFQRGAKWTAAPKPELKDELFDRDYEDPVRGEPMRYSITELEPVFDAADFTRCGRDIFCQKSNVTNEFGIEWLRRHLGDDYRIHLCEVNDPHPMHIDASLVPLAPGKLLINPERVSEVPALFRDWDVLAAPRPIHRDTAPLYMCSDWIGMNVFMLDQKRVCVEHSEEPFIRALRRWGFEPIPIKMRHFNTFGGGFHCCTLDVRRRGRLQSYF